MPSYNLVDEPWIPVTWISREFGYVSLSELFSNIDRIADICVHPHERIALLRFLLCICYASLPEEENFDPHHFATACLHYLSEWHEVFWLHHPTAPFLQIPNLRPLPERPLTAFSFLDCTRASGHTRMVFDRIGEKAEFSQAQLALGLITVQICAPYRSLGKVVWNSCTMPMIGNASPVTSFSSLHTFLRGKDLGSTLALNWVPKSILERYYGLRADDWFGHPIWELFPQGPDDKERVKNATQSFLGSLVPLMRSILLLAPEGMIFGAGLKYPRVIEEGKIYPLFLEPSATLYMRKKGAKECLSLLSLSEQRFSWRILPVLLQFSLDTTKERGPLALYHLKHRTDVAPECEIIAIGLQSDPVHTAKLLDLVEEITPFYPYLLKDEEIACYTQALKKAEKAASCLRDAISVFHTSRSHFSGMSVRQEGSAATQALLSYWTSIECSLGLILSPTSATIEEKLLRWKNFVFCMAKKIYDIHCGDMSPRILRSYIYGLKEFHFTQSLFCFSAEKEDLMQAWLSFLDSRAANKAFIYEMSNPSLSSVKELVMRFCQQKEESYSFTVFAFIGRAFLKWRKHHRKGDAFGYLVWNLCDQYEREAVLRAQFEDRMGPMATKLSCLLSSPRESICSRVASFLQSIEKQEYFLDFAQLGRDLLHWSDTIKKSWAWSFWDQTSPGEEKSSCHG